MSKAFLRPVMFFSFLRVAIVLAMSGAVLAQNNSTDWAARNFNTIQSIYNLTVYPKNVPVLQQGGKAVPPGLFSQNARGRVSPLGNFTGFEESVEYFFALAPTPQQSPGGVGIYEAELAEFTSGCPNVAASTVYLKTGKVDNITGALLDPNDPTTTALKQVAFWRFDDQGLVEDYDAWIPNLQAWLKAGAGIDYGNLIVQEGSIAAALCPTIQQRCTGSNQQYSSVVDCITQLSLKPFGNFDEVWGDNIACRTIHAILTGVDPVVHCPHVGPRGGNGPDNYKCVDVDYNEYFDDAAVFGGPDRFKC